MVFDAFPHATYLQISQGKGFFQIKSYVMCVLLMNIHQCVGIFVLVQQSFEQYGRRKSQCE